MQYFPPPSVYYSSPQQATAAAAAAAASNAAHPQPTSQLHLHMQQQQQQPTQQPHGHPTTLAAYTQQPLPHPYSQTPQAAGMIAFQHAQLQSAMQQQHQHQQQQQLQQQHHQQQQQQHQQQQQQGGVPAGFGQQIIHYSPTGGPPPYGFYASSAVAGRPGMVPAGQPMFVPPHLQRMYAAPAPPPHAGFAATQPVQMLPTFSSPQVAAAQHSVMQPRPSQLVAMQPAAAAATLQPQPMPHVAAAVAVSPAQASARAATSLQAAAPASSVASATSTTSTAAASIAAGMQPGAAIPALRSTFAAAGQPIPAHFRPQPPVVNASLPPPLTNVSSSSTTLTMSPSDVRLTIPPITSVFASSSRGSPYTIFSSGSSSKEDRGAAKRGEPGKEASAAAVRSAADSAASALPSTRRPQLLHTRSAALPSSSSSSTSRSPPNTAVNLPRPALIAQRSLPVVGSSNAQWRYTVAATERVRISDKLGSYLAADQLDVEQLLTLAACMAEESMYERADCRLDYMKRSVELQVAIARLAANKRTRAAIPAVAARASPADSSDADVTGLLALAQSSVEQKQSELSEWGQKSTEERAEVSHSLDEQMRKRRRERPNESTDTNVSDE